LPKVPAGRMGKGDESPNLLTGRRVTKGKGVQRGEYSLLAKVKRGDRWKT